jgi:hypothetical protein
MRHLEFNEHNFEVLLDAYEELEAKYDERGMAMRETGETVRSLFLPYILRISAALRNHGSHRNTITEIQDALDELNKHTPIS